ncbi:hypothetical protein [Pseudarthrobacter sp. NIBRBAC000502771]|uniref:hypothetical protein n=1 Tax=Pseudarthrobacter sp. NIBRBAC000502771 TaxID=2590774 RepID=UPI00113080FF|nr:hypothetical protein [Pseudarthrobacter sp. NIBRBAC000502771]QDG61160.1 hypothetical protein NIBR502771_01775 [Pseudarthrobacter sp. NIBRBAC000502771]
MSRPLRVTFGPGAFLPGAGLTVLVFGFPLGFPGYLYGTLSALILGMPLALVAGICMRPVRNQLLHAVAVGVAGLVTGVLTLMVITGSHWSAMWGTILWTGFCAALGRAAVSGLVTVHDAPAREPVVAQKPGPPLEP